MSRLGLGLALGFGLGVGIGCSPELEPLHWDEVDVEALRESLANPTGFVDEASVDEVTQLIIAREPAYRLLSDYFEDVFEDDEGGSARPPILQPQALDGTSVYVMIACPGSFADPYANPFADGMMRVDSPLLTDEFLASEELEGQLLLTFEHCRIDGYEFHGSAIAFRELDPGSFGFVPTLGYDMVDADDEPFVMSEALLWTSFDEGSALFELESTETLVFEWSVIGLEVVLRGTNGEFTCDVMTTEVECVPP